MILARQRRLHRPAPFVSENDEERRAQMHCRVLERAHHLRRDDVAGHAHDEELAESGVEQELWRHARVAAADDGGVGMLAPGEVGQDLFLHRRKPGLAAEEALVAGDEAQQRFIGRVAGRAVMLQRP